MAQSLYRTYRPQTFDDVVGQNHVEQTLRNAVRENNIAHAYLFTGPRGTGKTTSARLLAKALLCENGPTADPCGTCEGCEDIAQSTHPDVYELDAASRTGVDNVRDEIIGRVDFAPTRGKYKVYIIDEVHMLSTAAFNALLKTLEEPPAHVVFVLCTTEPRKVPETVRSRCQRFEFHRISQEEIVARLKFICDSEGFEPEEEALEFIARHSTGGMRDAITSLEALAAFGDKAIRYADAERLLGKVESTVLFEIASHVATHDVTACLKDTAALVEGGTDLSLFARDFAGHLRNLYVVALTGGDNGIIDTELVDLAALKKQVASFAGPEALSRALLMFDELIQKLRYAADKRLALEATFVRLAHAEADLTLEALAERIERLEKRAPVAAATVATAAVAPAGASAMPAPAPAAAVPAAALAVTASETAATSTPAAPAPVASAMPTPAPAAPASVAAVSAASVQGSTPAKGQAIAFTNETAAQTWANFMLTLKPSLKALFRNADVIASKDTTGIIIRFPKTDSIALDRARSERAVIAEFLRQMYGCDVPFEFMLSAFVGVCAPSPAPAPAVAASAAVASAPAAASETSPAPAASAPAPSIAMPALAPAPNSTPANVAPASADTSAPEQTASQVAPQAPYSEQVPLDAYDDEEYTPDDDFDDDDPSIPCFDVDFAEAYSSQDDQAVQTAPAANPYESLLSSAFGEGVVFTND